jgi:hypothetical protein
MGMGMNGKLTITVGSQQQTLKEPYGSAEKAVFGPYASSAMIPYTIDLKDSSCKDTTSVGLFSRTRPAISTRSSR